MTKTKIDWCDYTWNPVWGCLNPCPYCYARKLAKRFGDPTFKPTWKQKNFDKSFPKKPSRIFIGSMSDVAFWEDEWLTKVLLKIMEHPEHTFLMLTKNPTCYSRFDGLAPVNLWLGTTITNQSMLYRFGDLIFDTTWDETNKIFFSFEPLLERMVSVISPDWMIIGAETGNRKGKVIPKREWIAEIVDYCRANLIPVFLKDSLREIWDKELIREFPLMMKKRAG